MVRRKCVVESSDSDSDKEHLLSRTDDRVFGNEQLLSSAAVSPTKEKEIEHNEQMPQEGAKEDLIGKISTTIDNRASNAGEESPSKFHTSSTDDGDLLNMIIPEKPIPVMHADGTSDRLVISHMIVTNFKSYFGRHEVGPFHKNFTAIVGPNGSGKSNVIDALLFVFGYRAAKIRSKKVSVLIHSSSGHEDLSSCSVEVHFLTLGVSSKNEINHKFMVSRSAFRDNSSRYGLNGKSVQFREISDKLNEVGIDLIHNRFLILQGEVEQIALMKPKAITENEEGMLEYMEDIIGSSRLKVPINKLAEKIEQLQEERSAQLSRVKCSEEEKCELEGPMREVLDYLELENAIIRVQNRLWQLARYQVRIDLNAVNQQVSEKTEEIANFEREQAEINDKQKTQLDALRELQKVYNDAVKNEEKADAEFRELEKQDLKIRSDNRRLREKAQKLEADVKKENSKMTEQQQKPTQVDKTVKKLQLAIEDAEKMVEKAQKEIDGNLETLAEQSAEPQERRRKLEEELGRLVDKENKAGNKLILAQDNLRYMTSEQEIQNKKVADLETSLQDAQRKLHDGIKNYDTAKTAVPEITRSLEESTTELARLKMDDENLAKTAHEKQIEYETTRQRIDQSRKESRIVQFLMHKKRSGAIPGILGRLQLDNIVVDTIETGQKCVDAIKGEQLGVATFMALDKQTVNFGGIMSRPVQTPENVPRLFDLVTVSDPRLLPAFYYVLRDTLVVDTIARAKRLSMDGQKRWRVVTLKGELVDISGTMTGGGRQERRGRMGRKATAIDEGHSEQTEEMTKRHLETIRDKLSGVRDAIGRLEDTIRRTTEQLDTMIIVSGPAAEQELQSMRKTVEILAANLDVQRSKAKETIVDMEMVRKQQMEVLQLSKDRALSASLADEYRSRVTRVTAEIDLVSDRLIGAHQRALEAARNTKMDSERSMAKERAALRNVQRLLEKASKRLDDLRADLKETEDKLDANRKAMLDMETEAESQLNKQHSLTEQRERAKSRLDKFTWQHTEIDARTHELKKAIDGGKHQLTTFEHTQKTMTLRIEATDIKIGKLKLNDLKQFLDLRLHHTDEKSPANESFMFNESVFSAVSNDNDNDVPRKELMDLAPDEREENGGLINYTDEKLFALGGEDRAKFRLRQLEDRKQALKTPNVGVLAEYKRKMVKYNRLVAELTVLSSRRDKHRQMFDDLRKKRLGEFMEGFMVISLTLKEIYQMITLGGDASLDLVDSLDPFSEGIEFCVRPPRKSWKQISNLSGGEKTLASLAFVFALHHCKPTPLYVMDEIDAALDFRNVFIIAHYIKERTKNAQFVIVSLRNDMFEQADRLVGIYKTYDCTKHVVMDPDKVGLNTQDVEENRVGNNSKKHLV